MVEKTRKFTYPLLRYAFGSRKALSADAAYSAADKVQYLLKDEDPTITDITVYFTYEPTIPGFNLYFVICSLDRPDKVMRLPMMDNPLMEATFLDENDRIPQDVLNTFTNFTLSWGEGC